MRNLNNMASYCTCPIEDNRDYPGAYCLVCGKYTPLNQSSKINSVIEDVSIEKYDDIKEQNRLIAEEAADSAFYYGNLTVEQWITILNRLLNQATLRGMNINNHKSQ
jgi:hypothetical protein